MAVDEPIAAIWQCRIWVAGTAWGHQRRLWFSDILDVADGNARIDFNAPSGAWGWIDVAGRIVSLHPGVDALRIETMGWQDWILEGSSVYFWEMRSVTKQGAPGH